MTAGLKTGGYIYCLIVLRSACKCDRISATCCGVNDTLDALVLEAPVPVVAPVLPVELLDVEPVGVPVVEPLVPVEVPLEALPLPPLASFRIRSMAAMCDSTSLLEIAEPEVEPMEVAAPVEPVELAEPVDEAPPAASPPAAL